MNNSPKKTLNKGNYDNLKWKILSVFPNKARDRERYKNNREDFNIPLATN